MEDRVEDDENLGKVGGALEGVMKAMHPKANKVGQMPREERGAASR